MQDEGLLYQKWPLHPTQGRPDGAILAIYDKEIMALYQSRGYTTADLVSLSAATPNLKEILAKFSKEHHHTDDEVRFTVEGEGVFAIKGRDGEFLNFTAEPGDLIVIPGNRRHLFYLTEKTQIRTIRLFKDPKGWEAIY
jgi:1,2-dihydroxy-3-keto-5-methylthiopentene dioxygenase